MVCIKNTIVRCDYQARRNSRVKTGRGLVLSAYVQVCFWFSSRQMSMISSYYRTNSLFRFASIASKMKSRMVNDHNEEPP